MERILEALANDDLSTMVSTVKDNPEYNQSMKEICVCGTQSHRKQPVKKAGRSATGRSRVIRHSPVH